MTSSTFRSTPFVSLTPGRSARAARIRRAATLDHTTATLVIHQLSIVLTDDADVSELIAEILRGVRAGGAVVHCVGRDGREYDVVVTPSTEAAIVHSGPVIDDHSADGAWLASVELDY